MPRSNFSLRMSEHERAILASLASITGFGEAELIRHAVRRLIADVRRNDGKLVVEPLLDDDVGFRLVQEDGKALPKPGPQKASVYGQKKRHHRLPESGSQPA